MILSPDCRSTTTPFGWGTPCPLTTVSVALDIGDFQVGQLMSLAKILIIAAGTSIWVVRGAITALIVLLLFQKMGS